MVFHKDMVKMLQWILLQINFLIQWKNKKQQQEQLTDYWQKDWNNFIKKKQNEIVGIDYILFFMVNYLKSYLLLNY